MLFGFQRVGPPSQLEMRDMAGKVLWSATMVANNSSRKFDLPTLSAGVYILKASSGTHIIGTQKVIIN